MSEELENKEDTKYHITLVNVGFTNDKVPQFKELKNKPYVYYGETNDYPEYLVLLFNRSAKHNAIVTSKQLYIAGQGWMFDADGLDEKQRASLQAFIENPNPYESLSELSNKTILDYELFGGFYLKGIGSKNGKGPAELYHQDYCSVRSNEDNSVYYISYEWIDQYGAINERPEYKEIPAYDPNKKQKEFLLYVKMYRPSLKTYTLPDYIGAVPHLITDAEIANFHRAEIQNSFKGSKIIVFKNGLPAKEEQKTIERQLKAKFNPTDKAGSLVVDFVDDPTKVPDILDLDSGNFADKYNALNQTVQEEIFVGHKIISPMLFGVRVEGQLGGRDEMIDAYNLFQITYAKPRQQLQEKIFDLFASVKGRLKIKPLEPIMPTFGESTLMQILTKDEMRDIVGRKPLDKNVNANKSLVDTLNELSPLMANKVLNSLTQNEIRGIINKNSLPGGDVLPDNTPSSIKSPVNTPSGFSAVINDELDYSVFSKYGEPVENYVRVKSYKHGFSKQDFALSQLEQGVLDLIKKTPGIIANNIKQLMKLTDEKLQEIIDGLIAAGLISISATGRINTTADGDAQKTPSFTDLFIRYRYVLRPDAPALELGGHSRAFCTAMMNNPRYFTREDIDAIGKELGALYGIENYDAFRRRGGWYHDPEKDVNLPYCRHVWEAQFVKKIK